MTDRVAYVTLNLWVSQALCRSRLFTQRWLYHPATHPEWGSSGHSYASPTFGKVLKLTNIHGSPSRLLWECSIGVFSHCSILEHRQELRLELDDRFDSSKFSSSIIFSNYDTNELSDLLIIPSNLTRVVYRILWNTSDVLIFAVANLFRKNYELLLSILERTNQHSSAPFVCLLLSMLHQAPSGAIAAIAFIYNDSLITAS